MAVRWWEDLKEDGQELVVSMGENSLGCTSSNSSLETTTLFIFMVKFGDSQTWLLWRQKVAVLEVEVRKVG